MGPNKSHMSWDCPPEYWLGKNTQNQKIQKGLQPLSAKAKMVLDLVFENNFWDCKLLNINFPKDKIKKIAFTRPIRDITKFYSCAPKINLKKHTYNYDAKTVRKGIKDFNYDGRAVQNGFVSITPCAVDFLDKAAYLKLQGKRI